MLERYIVNKSAEELERDLALVFETLDTEEKQEIKTLVQDFVLIQNDLIEKYGKIAETLNILSNKNIEIPPYPEFPTSFALVNPVDINKPSWWKEVDLSSILEAIERITIEIPPSQDYSAHFAHTNSLLASILSELRKPQPILGARTIHRGGINLVENEIPTGTVDAVNTTFTLANTPKEGSLKVYTDGVRLLPTEVTGGKTFTVNIAPTSTIVCDYVKQ